MGGREIMIIAGLGYRAGCPADEIVGIIETAQARVGLRADILAIPAFKPFDSGVHEAATRLGLLLIRVDRPALERVQHLCPTPSHVVSEAVGLASIAEGCALAGAGMDARLLLARIKTACATCAVASGDPT
jgi:cobalt-precorrin 5A hydrolase